MGDSVTREELGRCGSPLLFSVTQSGGREGEEWELSERQVGTGHLVPKNVSFPKCHGKPLEGLKQGCG